MDKAPTIEELKTAIQGIIVKDYGDFKRKTITYLNRYSEEHNKLSDSARRQLDQLKWYIQFHPTHQIEATRQWALNKLDELH